MFRIERTIADAPRKKKEQVRRAQSQPIVDKFFDWCDAQAPHVLDETPIQVAIGYARNQRVALRRFLDDGRLPICNNVSELNLLELAPAYWNQTLEQPETQQKLAANVFRRVVLSAPT